MVTYAYVRISTDKQEMENQKFEILKYANQTGLQGVGKGAILDDSSTLNSLECKVFNFSE